SNFPFLNYIRLISVDNRLQRIESIYILNWILAITIKISSYIHIADEGLKEIFNEKIKNQFIYIVGIICIIVTYIFAEIVPRFMELIVFSPWEVVYYSIHKTILPIIAVIVYLIRRKTIDPRERSEN